MFLQMVCVCNAFLKRLQLLAIESKVFPQGKKNNVITFFLSLT